MLEGLTDEREMTGRLLDDRGACFAVERWPVLGSRWRRRNRPLRESEARPPAESHTRPGRPAAAVAARHPSRSSPRSPFTRPTPAALFTRPTRRWAVPALSAA